MKNNKILISMAIVATVILVGLITTLGILFINSNNTTKKYNSSIEKAVKYFESGDYENAIISYEYALELNQSDENAYLGLASSYINLSNLDSAHNILMQGYSITGSENILNMLVKYFNYGSEQANGNNDKPSLENSIALNKTLISYFAGYTFEDYENKYGKVSLKKDGGKYIASYSSVDAEFKYYDITGYQLIDSKNGTPFSNAKPAQIVVKDLTLLFPGMEDTVAYSFFQDKGVTSLKCEFNSSFNSYAVSFSFSGCKFLIASDENGNVSANADNVIEPISREKVAGTFELKGKITSATTGAGVADVKLKIREGSSKSGTVVEECKTDNNGTYSVELEAGDYTIQTEKEDWSEEFFQVRVNDFEDTTTFDMVISPELLEGEVRIVLTWGSAPNDLDSYLDGRTSENVNVNINYMNKEVTNNGNIIAQLDVDDISAYGPETITLYNINGTYTYTVKDFGCTGTMAQSDATVKVYFSGSSSPRTYTVPSSAVNTWTVFEIENGNITDINSGS